MSHSDKKIRCDERPFMCHIADGKAGACDRYARTGTQQLAETRGNPWLLEQLHYACFSARK